MQSSLHEKVKASPEALDLLSKMLIYNPKKRITAFDAINHPWFKTSPLP